MTNTARPPRRTPRQQANDIIAAIPLPASLGPLAELTEHADGARTLAVLPGPDQQTAAAVITRLPDHTLRFEPGPNAAISRYDTIQPAWQALHDPEAEAQHKLLNDAVCVHFGTQDLSGRRGAIAIGRDIRQHAAARAAALRQDIVIRRANGETATQTAVITPNQSLTAIINRVLRNRFIDRKVSRLAERCFNLTNTEIPSPEQYNYALRNRRALTGLISASPIVAVCWCRSRTAEQLGDTTPLNPAHAVRYAKQGLAATPSEWGILTAWQGEFRPRRDEHILDYLREFLPLARAVHEANPVRMPTDRLSRLFANQIAHRTETITDAVWNANRHCTPWQAWVHAIGRYLSAPETDEPLTEPILISDMLDDAIARDLPWRMAPDWATYDAHTRQWHAEQREYRRQLQQSEHQASVWDSPAPAFAQDGYQARPVTGSAELVRLAHWMNNCLASYHRGCRNGNDAVFAVRQAGQLAGAIHISRRNAHSPWRAGQAEGMGANSRERQRAGRQLKPLTERAALLANRTPTGQADNTSGADTH